MKKKKFYYIERFNVVDRKVDGFFITKAVNLDELLLKLDNDDDFAGDTPYLPQVYEITREITREQYNAFPYMAPMHKQLLVSYE